METLPLTKRGVSMRAITFNQILRNENNEISTNENNEPSFQPYFDNCLKNHEISKKPLVPWAGGKTDIKQIINENMPLHFNKYFEPFIGGGAIFFDNQFKNACISDTNFDLISLYRVIKYLPNALIKKVNIHLKNNCQEYFDKVKWQHHLRHVVSRAARLFYLINHTFNSKW